MLLPPRIIARHCDYVLYFELCVFSSFKKLPKYQQALDAGAEELETMSAALDLLTYMSQAESFDDEVMQDIFITPGNQLMREAWYEEVVRQGLQVDEYVALRQFKGLTNNCFRDHDRAKPADALRVLKSSLPVPADCAQYKQPLMKLLELLSRFAPREFSVRGRYQGHGSKGHTV